MALFALSLPLPPPPMLRTRGEGRVRRRSGDSRRGRQLWEENESISEGFYCELIVLWLHMRDDALLGGRAIYAHSILH